MNARWCGLVAAGLMLFTSEAGGQTRISRFNEYAGYSAPRFERARRTSVHVAMRDGIKRAVDVYLPLQGERVVADRLPVIYLSQRYVRAWKNPDGTIDSPVARVERDGSFRIGDGGIAGGFYSWYLGHGYAVVIADMRGAGASFGPEIEFNSLQAGEDEYDVIEWIASQPWSSGKTGMLGISYGAESQLMAAAMRPPHLSALFAAAPEFDRFHGEAFVMGGISRTGWTAQWLQSTQANNAVTAPTAPPPGPTRQIAPVDSDRNGRMLEAALEERRRANAAGQGTGPEFEVIAKIALQQLYWDEVPFAASFQNKGVNHLANSLARIDASGIPIYFLSGWFDSYTNGATRYFNNTTMPRRLTLGPWPHGPTGFPAGVADPRGAEYVKTLKVDGLRWFDHWLKGVDNGILRDPPVSYAVMETPERWSWKSTDRWPPSEAVRILYFLGEGPSGSIQSVNDGLLTTDRVILEKGASDRWTVSYGTTTGRRNRWMAASGSKMDYGNLAPNDAKGLTYTTTPLAADVTVVGHPVITIYATSTAADGDFIAYLEEVDQQGVSHYLSDGMLRASHRTLGQPPYRYGGLPIADARRKVVEATPPLSSGVAELMFELYPTANRFDRGNRIRVTIVGIDRGNTQTPILDPAPTVTLFHSSRYPSRIELPIIVDRAN